VQSIKQDVKGMLTGEGIAQLKERLSTIRHVAGGSFDKAQTLQDEGLEHGDIWSDLLTPNCARREKICARTSSELVSTLLARRVDHLSLLKQISRTSGTTPEGSSLAFVFDNTSTPAVANLP
jgi:hypothetical protein